MVVFMPGLSVSAIQNKWKSLRKDYKAVTILRTKGGFYGTQRLELLKAQMMAGGILWCRNAKKPNGLVCAHIELLDRLWKDSAKGKKVKLRLECMVQMMRGREKQRRCQSSFTANVDVPVGDFVAALEAVEPKLSQEQFNRAYIQLGTNKYLRRSFLALPADRRRDFAWGYGPYLFTLRGVLSLDSQSYVGGEVSYLGNQDPDYISVATLQNHMKKLECFNVVAFSCKFDEEEIIDGYDYIHDDLDVILIVNRIKREKRESLHLYTQHTLDTLDDPHFVKPEVDTVVNDPSCDEDEYKNDGEDQCGGEQDGTGTSGPSQDTSNVNQSIDKGKRCMEATTKARCTTGGSQPHVRT
ncbi:hypothetical protein CJ030_MR2G012397 [Morella rubra]|uniref:PB1-like domain-containing protein n=1 Tax=Morella rubra TaxID=262757 RepID=A0A6A1WKL2_9ROSI|nr:hypothetical protein CJ030_MR2G012397 [Morella rubra]